MRSLVLALALAMTAVGCAGTSYYYQPAEQATATVSGYPAARYIIPADTRLGDVRITSLGIDDLQLSENEDPVRALHIRLVIANERGQQDWYIDTRSIVVQFPSRPNVLSAALVNSDGQGMPVITIPRGEARTIDTYHLLPGNIEQAIDLPTFDVIWHVQTDERRIVSERTPFERRAIEPPPTYGYGMYSSWGYGAYPFGPWGGWYDPWYSRPIIIQRVTPAPRVYYYPRR